MQEHNYNFQTNNSSSSNDAGQPYEYVFTGGQGSPMGMGGEPPRHQKSRGGRFALQFIAAILGIAVLFGGGYAFANWREDQIPPEVDDPSQENGPIQQIAPNGDNLHESPEDILIKTEASASPFGSAGENPFAISDVVKMVEDAVVVIDTTVTSDSVWGSNTSTGAGSGVLVSSDGYILTCNHVIDGATRVLVTLNNGDQYEASLVGRDAPSDLAVLKIEAEEPLSYVKHGSSADLIAGEYVVAIGNPLGSLGGTVTKGIISATERRIRMSDGTVMTLLQTDAAINSGNSGGGLFNLKGELIGIVNAKYTATGVEGLGFAIPVDTAYAVELDLIRYSYVRGVVDHGLTTVDVTESNLRSYYYYYKISEIGLYVSESKYTDQIKAKDRILEVNDVEVNTQAELWSVISGCEVGDEITLLIGREEERFTVKLVLRERVPEDAIVDFG